MRTLPLIALIAGCSGPAADPAAPGGDDSGADSAGTCTTIEPVAGPKDTGDGPRTARTISGSVTWTVDFDLVAEDLGYVDCTYTRDYNALLERTDLGYLCPSCTLLTQGTAVMTSGYDDCYTQIDDGASSHVEQLGLVEGDAGSTLWRSGTENVTLAEAGPLVDGAVTWSDTGDLDAGGSVTLTAKGTLELGESDSTVADPTGARTEPYTCGWPLFSPGGPVASYTAAMDTTFPNARLRDLCTDRVDLWDLRGRYVIVDASSPNCGPCQTMASMAEAFKTEMADACIDVELVTLLNAGLSEVNKSPDDLTVREWVQVYGLSSPVLADEGFGYAVLAPAINPDGGMSLPSIAVLNPEGVVIYLDSGFGETTGYFEPIKQAILADRAE